MTVTMTMTMALAVAVIMIMAIVTMVMMTVITVICNKLLIIITLIAESSTLSIQTILVNTEHVKYFTLNSFLC